MYVESRSILVVISCIQCAPRLWYEVSCLNTEFVLFVEIDIIPRTIFGSYILHAQRMGIKRTSSGL